MESESTPIGFLAQYSRLQTTEGDFIYVPQITGRPEIIANQQGAMLLTGDPVFQRLLTEPMDKRVKKHTAKLATGKIEVAVKQLGAHTTTTDPIGTELFDAIRHLIHQGVFCAEPIAATHNKYVAKWIKGKETGFWYDTGDDFRRFFIELLKKQELLVSEGKWKPSWLLDYSPGNFKVMDPTTPDLFKKFIAIDPIIRLEHPDARKKYQQTLRNVLNVES